MARFSRVDAGDARQTSLDGAHGPSGVHAFFMRPRRAANESATRENSALQGVRETGATGFEPATSGVTGRAAGDDTRRLSATIADICSGIPESPGLAKRF
jgi:hypothetical protein